MLCVGFVYRGPRLVAATSLVRTQALECAGSVAVEHELGCSMESGVRPDQADS